MKIIIFILSVLWFIYDPGYEPLIASLASIPNIYFIIPEKEKKGSKKTELVFLYVSIAFFVLAILVKIINVNINTGIKGDNNDNNKIIIQTK